MATFEFVDNGKSFNINFNNIQYTAGKNDVELVIGDISANDVLEIRSSSAQMTDLKVFLPGDTITGVGAGSTTATELRDALEAIFFLDEGGGGSGSPLESVFLGEFASQVDQNPTGLGLSNAINITYGAGGSTSGGEFDLDSNGVVTCNMNSIQYSFNVGIRIARSGAGGVSEILARMMYANDGVNYVQIGSSFGAKVDDADTVWRENFSLDFSPAVGSKIYVEIARNNGSSNSGGLGTFQPSGDLASWNQINSASLAIYKKIVQ
tara:strand:+ start:190 stop:984 length:795 start_codon:yes stop_codon:yes gene_type:complete